MTGWPDGRMAGWLDGWMAGWLDGWMAGWLDGWLDARAQKSDLKFQWGWLLHNTHTHNSIHPCVHSGVMHPARRLGLSQSSEQSTEQAAPLHQRRRSQEKIRRDGDGWAKPSAVMIRGSRRRRMTGDSSSGRCDVRIKPH